MVLPGTPPHGCLLLVVEQDEPPSISHNARFAALMDAHLPQWHHHRQTLNRLPVRHEDREY